MKIRSSGLIAILFFTLIQMPPVSAADPSVPATTAKPGSVKLNMTKSDLQMKAEGKPFTVEGEVVDAWCYSSHTMGTGRGEKHKPCAQACILGGVSAGIVDDQGTLYIAAKHVGYEGCQKMLLPLIAKRVKATGWLTTTGGCNLMKIRQIEEIKLPKVSAAK